MMQPCLNHLHGISLLARCTPPPPETLKEWCIPTWYFRPSRTLKTCTAPLPPPPPPPPVGGFSFSVGVAAAAAAGGGAAAAGGAEAAAGPPSASKLIGGTPTPSRVAVADIAT